MNQYILVGVGGFLGSVVRYLLSTLISFDSPTSIPLGTFLVNVIGCFVIGVIYSFSERFMIGSEVRLFLATGVCGGFTTFSAFSAESIVLFRDGNYTFAVLYILSSVIVGLLATIFGWWIVKSM